MGNLSLNIGLNALLTSQAALDTIGHNIANANTPGYSRQSLALQPDRSMQLRGLQLGSGVDARTVERTVDEFINRRLFGQASTLKHLEARLAALADTEVAFGEPGENGVASVLQDMFAKFAELSSSPSDTVARSSAVASVDALAAGVRGVGGELARIETELVGRARAAVDQANNLAQGIADLNVQIVGAEVGGAPANDLRDRRELLVRQLAEQIEVTTSETPRGALHVFADGQMIVGDTNANALNVEQTEGEGVHLMVAGGTQPVEASSGTIGGLFAFMESTLPELRSGLDQFARNLVLEVNRRHSTGTPPSGGFQRLTGDLALVDVDGDGSVLDERLDGLEGPFQVQDGELFVHVVRRSTGEIDTHRIAIDAGGMTVGDFLGELSDIPQLSAQVDSTGRIQIQAGADFTFDFSRRVDTDGASQGTLGGGGASLGSLGSEPFGLVPGDTLTLDSGGGPFTVTFQPADFESMATASAQEVAAAINADANTAANGLRAVASGDRVFLQTLAQGAAATFDLVGGGAALALGWAPGTTVVGQDRPVEIQLTGDYAGTSNQSFTFRAATDGEIGATPGLEIEVLDRNGAQIARLDVGDNYLPGTELELPDGLHVSFSSGQVSATDGDAFTRHFLADSDTSDVLVALGLNGLLAGTDAQSIEVAQRILEDPQQLASSATGLGGDNGILLALAELQEAEVEGLGESVSGFYSRLVGELGLKSQSTNRALEVEDQLMQSLETRRDQVSGVSLDEELVNLIQFEQAFGAASRFIQVANALQDEVLNLL